jgi:hypothetical protein
VFAMIDLDIQLVHMAMALINSESMSLIYRTANNSQRDSKASPTSLYIKKKVRKMMSE